MKVCLCVVLCASMVSAGLDLLKEIVSVKQPIVETVATIGSSQCGNVKKLLGVEYEQIEGEKEPDLNQLTLRYITPTLNISFNINTVSDVLLQLPRDKKLAIFVHGFTDDPTKVSFKTVSDSFMKNGKYYILALDGSSLIRWLYLRSTTYVRFMGEKLGSILASLAERGYDPANLHIIGHSLGAHISGFTGKQFSQQTGALVGRVTALDPAGPCFSEVHPDLRVNSTDASFVDAIHTDSGVYGMVAPVGQVDYFPNEGKQQPGCVSDVCGHSRAWQYWAESVEREDAFPAVRCASWEAFRKGSCEKEVSYMGLASQPGTTGLYYLQTAKESPYGLGAKGTVYENNEGIVKSLLYG